MNYLANGEPSESADCRIGRQLYRRGYAPTDNAEQALGWQLEAAAVARGRIIPRGTCAAIAALANTAEKWLTAKMGGAS